MNEFILLMSKMNPVSSAHFCTHTLCRSWNRFLFTFYSFDCSHKNVNLELKIAGTRWIFQLIRSDLKIPKKLFERLNRTVGFVTLISDQLNRDSFWTRNGLLVTTRHNVWLMKIRGIVGGASMFLDYLRNRRKHGKHETNRVGIREKKERK